jgi:transcriptional regulator with XRE-family HTH domain
MIPEALAEEIRRRLATGKQSMRKIAGAVGVSRGAVAKIAYGKRRRPTACRAGPNASLEEPLGRIDRCPECGALAHAPCRACRVRNWIRTLRSPRPRQPAEEPLGLDLAGECRQRYEEVHARRIREAWDEDE